MAIKLDCPRCKQPPGSRSKKAGSYATVRAGGRFWVPDDATDRSGRGGQRAAGGRRAAVGGRRRRGRHRRRSPRRPPAAPLRASAVACAVAARGRRVGAACRAPPVG